MNTIRIITLSVVFISLAYSHSDGYVEGPLRITVLQPSKRIIAGKTAFFRVQIENISAKPVNLPKSKWITQFITTESKSFDHTILDVRHTGLSLGYGKDPVSDLEPAKKIIVAVWHIFPEPGHYTLKCILKTSVKGTSWSFWEGEVKSETIRIKAEKYKGS